MNVEPPQLLQTNADGSFFRSRLYNSVENKNIYLSGMELDVGTSFEYPFETRFQERSAVCTTWWMLNLSRVLTSSRWCGGFPDPVSSPSSDHGSKLRSPSQNRLVLLPTGIIRDLFRPKRSPLLNPNPLRRPLATSDPDNYRTSPNTALGDGRPIPNECGWTDFGIKIRVKNSTHIETSPRVKQHFNPPLEQPIRSLEFLNVVAPGY
ncbi:hypothetical protein AVEN_156450-1 [Araneus ventricosus]|uniref:Uncharacterized protein n=1 Tax=Araneus ventricosus TaxID=182803 RepID=A0A4Y2K0I7_ARAVE|nr:hypothetical protein AVEN_156450-1 [Araneus ventricosus]